MSISAIQCRGDLDADIQDAKFGDHLTALDPGIQAAAIGQFHHEVAVIFGFVKAVNMNDVAVAQAGSGLGLPQESLYRFGVVHELGLHQLDGHFPLKHRIKGAINGPHPSPADYVA